MRRSGDGSHYKVREVGMFRKLMLAMAIVVAMLALTEASYAGGLFLTEIGTEDVALAGAGWAARAQDASTLFKNPAGMSLLEGNQFQGGLQALYFNGGFSGTNTPFGGNGGGNPVGVAPAASAFYVHSFSKDFKVGLGVLSNFGLGEKYDQGWAGRYYVKQADVGRGDVCTGGELPGERTFLYRGRTQYYGGLSEGYDERQQRASTWHWGWADLCLRYDRGSRWRGRCPV